MENQIDLQRKRERDFKKKWHRRKIVVLYTISLIWFVGMSFATFYSFYMRELKLTFNYIMLASFLVLFPTLFFCFFARKHSNKTLVRKEKAFGRSKKI